MLANLINCRRQKNKIICFELKRTLAKELFHILSSFMSDISTNS